MTVYDNNGRPDEYDLYDCRIHSMRFFMEEWNRDFILDIDYIVEGPLNDDPPFNFIITKGEVSFPDLQSISFSVDSGWDKYKRNVFNLIVFSFEKIADGIVLNGKVYGQWRINLSDNNFITIVASAMKFSRCRNTITVDRLHLYSSERDSIEK